MSKREKVLLLLGCAIGVTPFVAGLCRELGCQGLLLALVILGIHAGAIAGLFYGPHPTSGSERE
ncbi:MAG: hypothetical protein G01um101431_857 [Parcubacteria group bacterium Gr01-1014_31]|nr:MAG: hypothetical protein G01um101431_857 [Parcubacteria group bacterium Gr01-1014_31]